ncbi:hypothetical protein [Actinoalloteichus caeruleus]|uniref:hypothetical protein n=1 Tax=Actinoalloteichus cyanogriseus TaxID=2893586 RepID=UPI0004AA125E|nr:hypothetical protein [Actinoalloteichus caeruleus]
MPHLTNQAHPGDDSPGSTPSPDPLGTTPSPANTARDERRGAGSTPLRRVLLAAGALVLVAGAVIVVRQTGLVDEAPTALPVTASTPATLPPEPTAGHGDRTGDGGETGALAFTDTVAAEWEEGIDGIDRTVTTPVEGHSRDQVAEAVDLALRAVEATRLDPEAIEEHSADPLLDLLGPDARADTEEHIRRLGLDAFVTMISPEHTLADEPPRMDGRVSVTAEEEGVLVVEVSYLAGYLFESHPAVVFQRQTDEFLYYSGEEWLESSWGLWAGGSDGLVYGMDCDLIDEGLLAPATSADQVVAGLGGVDEQAMFDLDSELPGSTC